MDWDIPKKCKCGCGETENVDKVEKTEFVEHKIVCKNCKSYLGTLRSYDEVIEYYRCDKKEMLNS